MVIGGAPTNNAGGFQAGQAVVYRLNTTGDQWELVDAPLLGEVEKKFGTQVEINNEGNRVFVVSATGNPTHFGSVQAYDLSPTNEWIQVGQKVEGTSTLSSIDFALDISADGNSFVSGHRGSWGNIGAGEIKVYTNLNADGKLWEIRLPILLMLIHFRQAFK